MTNPILSVEQVTITFDGFTVLDQLDFQIERGELRFLIGPNGAGKTTLLDVITGRVRPQRGRVLFGGQPIHDLEEHVRVRRGIGRKFQAPSIFPSLTVAQNLEVPLGFREPLPGLLRRLPSDAQDRLAETLSLIGLESQAHRPAGALSHGEKQWLEIGMLLAQSPQLLLLDEPVAGMTRRERDRTGELIQRISSERSTLVVEHDMAFVRQFSQTVTVLHAGRVLCEGTMGQVGRDERVIEVYLGRGQLHQAA